MTQEKLIDAITELDSDILNRYFDMKADLAAKKKQKISVIMYLILCLNINGRSGHLNVHLVGKTKTGIFCHRNGIFIVKHVLVHF